MKKVCEVLRKIKDFSADVCANLVEAIICLLIALFTPLAILTSPVWFSIWIFINADNAASWLNKSRIPNGYSWYDRCRALIYRTMYQSIMKKAWYPLTAIFPMKYRREFIAQGDKILYKYATKTQVAVYKMSTSECKRCLISNGYLSEEARDLIWEDASEWENYVLSGKTLTDKQIKDLIVARGDGASTLLWSYFKSKTPGKEMIASLLVYAHQGYGTAMYVLVEFIKQQRPGVELIDGMLSVNDNNFIKRVNEIIDDYADLDAVNFKPEDIGDDLDDTTKISIAKERWTNFCLIKKTISPAAQKKMCFWQYEIYALTDHHLNPYALQRLLLSADGTEYLTCIINNEFEAIKANEKLVTALKSEYWRYSTYLAAKRKFATAA